MNTEVVNSYIPIYVKAFLLTLKIGWVGVALAFVLGIAGAFVLYFKLPVLSALIRAYVELFRNTPLLVQLFFIYGKSVWRQKTGAIDFDYYSQYIFRIFQRKEKVLR